MKENNRQTAKQFKRRHTSCNCVLFDFLLKISLSSNNQIFPVFCFFYSKYMYWNYIYVFIHKAVENFPILHKNGRKKFIIPDYSRFLRFSSQQAGSSVLKYHDQPHHTFYPSIKSFIAINIASHSVIFFRSIAFNILLVSIHIFVSVVESKRCTLANLLHPLSSVFSHSKSNHQ